MILVVATIGTYLLVGSHAASPYTSTTADSGTHSSGAVTCPSTATNDGNSVVFTSPVAMDGNVALGLSCPGTPFAASSFWNTPLPSDTPLNTNNAAYSNVIAYNLCHDYPVESTPPSPCSTPTYDGSLASTAWSAPLYVVPANQPYVPVQPYCSSGTTPPRGFANILTPGVPIPADAHAAAGTDEEVQIYQPSSNKYWDFWQFQQDGSGNWQACFGGLINNVSGSDGIVPSGLGALSTGLPLLGGVVRTEELEAGQIDHVIGLELPDMLSQSVVPANTSGTTNGISWPATRSDGVSTDPLAVPEGLRFRLPPGLNLAQYDLSPIAMAIAVAAQKYGFVLFEQTGVTTGNVQIDLGDSTTYTTADLANPYTTGPGVGGVNDGNKGLFDGVLFGSVASVIMNNFPWSQLQALPFNYGEPSGS